MSHPDGGLYPWYCDIGPGLLGAFDCPTPAQRLRDINHAGSEAQQDIEETIAATGSTIAQGGRDALDSAANAAERASRAAAEPLKWLAFVLGAVVTLVLLGLFVWFIALPLWGLGGAK
ncbi:MAG: hypothetical protein IIA54_00470 [Chloroflexi bacterium]|nr:hypothetical protein [Chloroflexota bacterium]